MARPKKLRLRFVEYIKRVGYSISKDEFLMSVDHKLNGDEFQDHITSLLRPQVEFEFAGAWIMFEISLLAGFLNFGTNR